MEAFFISREISKSAGARLALKDISQNSEAALAEELGRRSLDREPKPKKKP